MVFEIYPATAASGATRGLRLGFAVEDVQRTVDVLLLEGASLVRAPKDSPWGVRAVLDDPEGHRLEITASSGPAS